MGIDEMRIDEVRIDEVGIIHNNTPGNPWISRDLTYDSGSQGFIKKFWDFALFRQPADHIVDIHNIYEINLISK